MPSPKWLDRVSHTLHCIDERTEKIVSQLDDLNAALSALQTAVTDASSRTAADLKKLEDELTAAQSAQGVDLSGPITTVQALQQSVAGIDPAAAAAAPPTGGSAPSAGDATSAPVPTA